MADWESIDVEHYNRFVELGILDDYWSPEEELKSRKGRDKRRQLKRGRREHNEGAIERAIKAKEQAVEQARPLHMIA